MASWEEWVQDVGGSVINAAADAKFTQPYQIQRLQMEALGEGGYYTEGQAGVKSRAGAISIEPTTLLLIGAAVVALLMLKD